MKKILIINGPNLNLLGHRDPAVYGSETLADTLARVSAEFASHTDLEIQHFQSNSEGAIIDAIHEAGFDPDCVGIVINPGAYAHYSYAIADAMAAVPVPIVEVHISNIFARDEFRHTSVTAPSAVALISGAGRDGYSLAVNFLIKRL